MRQDAIRRVQEMQRRARMNLNNTNRSIHQPPNEQPEAPTPRAEAGLLPASTQGQATAQEAPQVQSPQGVVSPAQAPQGGRDQAAHTAAQSAADQTSQVEGAPTAQAPTYTDELVYHNPIAPSYIDNDEVIEPVTDGLDAGLAPTDAEYDARQPEVYPPPDGMGMQGFGGSGSVGQGGGGHARGHQSTAPGGSHNTLGGLLSSLLGTGNKSSGGIGADSIMDTVAGLKSNFGETISSTLSSVTSPVTQIMDAFGIDSDKLIIIALILILLNEKSDKTLLLALGYLLIF